MKGLKELCRCEEVKDPVIERGFLVIQVGSTCNHSPSNLVFESQTSHSVHQRHRLINKFICRSSKVSLQETREYL
jgi:hypothetical protein